MSQELGSSWAGSWGNPISRWNTNAAVGMRPQVLTQWVSPKLLQCPHNIESGFYWDQLRGRARRSCVSCYDEVLEPHSIVADWLCKTALFNIGDYECTGIHTDKDAWGYLSVCHKGTLFASSLPRWWFMNLLDTSSLHFCWLVLYKSWVSSSLLSFYCTKGMSVWPET